MKPNDMLSLLAICCLLCVCIAQDFSCGPGKPCTLGCCSKYNVCGMGPTFCGAGNCTSECDAKSECDPGFGSSWAKAEKCPLNVCCSKYGFCGTTQDFCGNTKVESPSCGGTSSNKRTIGYYEGWSHTRKCDAMSPEEIPIGAYTHLNFAFAFIDPASFAIAPMAQDQVALYKRTTRLKELNPGMEVWIAIGGWSMNDPDQATHATFSTLAGSKVAQGKFFTSLISFMQNYGFDGVDIDWEYPVAPERSGNEQDLGNFVSFLEKLKQALGGSGHKYGLSITLPSSYWYLKNFDIVKIAKTVDWFNMMSYDLHGTWDSTNKWIGSIVQAHTNLTEIDLALQLLWRNKIDPSKVILGLGFYGRSFTLSDPSCTSPGCSFSGGGNAGECTDSVGTLSYAEITRVIAKGAKVTTNKDAAVKQVVYGGNQWISYDDAETLKIKVDYANKHCLGGTMVWAVSLDDDKGSAADALSKSTGRKALAASADRSNPYKAQGPCYITECFETPTCPSGYGAVQQINGDKQNVKIEHGCGKGEKRTYCCPSNDMPTCQWRGGAPACDIKGKCQSDEVSLTSDTGGGCTSGHKNLCCKKSSSNQPLSQCVWKGSAPRCETGNKCPSDKPKEIARSISGDNQQKCDVYGFGDAQTKQLKVFCCTDPPPYTGCDWYTNGDDDPPPSPRPAHCTGRCPSGKTLVATDDMCYFGGTRAFCCDPANTYNDNFVTDFKNKLLSFNDDHTCPGSQLLGPVHAKRSKEADQAVHDIQARDFKSFGGYETLQLLYAALPLGSQVSSFLVQAFNEVVGNKINLHAVQDLQTGIDADPYGDPIFALAWMLCEWDKSSNLVKNSDDTEEVCILPPNDLDFSQDDTIDSDDPVYKKKRQISTNVSATQDDYNDQVLHERVVTLTKRIFFEDNAATGPSPGNLPPTGLLMQAVMNDDLPLLYMQRQRYLVNDPNNRDRDTILEVVYDLQDRPDLQMTTAQTANGPNRADRFAVFHFHTIGVEPGTNGEPGYPLIPYFHVFHAQTVINNPRRPTEFIVYGRNTGLGRGAPPGPQARTEILSCGRHQGQRLVWVPGSNVARPLPPMAQTVNDFGTFMRNAGILTADSFQAYDAARAARGGWDWDPDPNHPEHYVSEQIGPMEQGLRQPPVNMDPRNGFPTK